ncbi:Membrane protease subunit, stomatin/prohibitin family, contains C-terminal Zn-ribbon domain [Actinobaculum suis]|uniref:Membrane protease subunit, stomatin/prohibitin family, contains C-terminal Zn-ribbon domain n=1 Tax=Actinobaculum suis TaxID=1657 RepID=A0A1G7CT79_9ACTO|nr:SPFH domain-containing protein [Actinobaculum suis]MDY5152452.1 SPFH domain-containing protein [Actinobaculum suis]OCA95417.1 virion core protein (lumpy skin disease virus) [Actinobaculum suis]SDE42431.1 Membrane protease subunit, stomatin/prohibitin family, contains C-terminal Zn-ribbon domain [Actinobaculum suis]VDG75653.1 Putative virion core protein (lumpy skin disease virus) [Actinobaculum suis]
MGFIKAFAGAIGGAFADQWLDFLTLPADLLPTAALAPAVMQEQNAGRGSNTRHSRAIVSNGSRVVVPQGYGLVTLIDGRITSFIAEPGGYVWNPGDQNAKTLFVDGLISPTLTTSWQRFKFGGQPGAQHVAIFVNLKEITGNRFGTQSQIHWDDAFLGTQVGAVARGTYTLRISDPFLFITNLVPATYLQPDAPVFDFTDSDNPVGEQLFTELVGSLAAAFSRYSNDSERAGRIANLQADSVGFARSLSAAVEENYHWTSRFGLIIPSVAIAAIEYDADTTKLLSDVRKADALAGQRGNAFLQQSAARGVQAAGEAGGGGLAMFGMGAGMAGGLAALQQPVGGAGAAGTAAAAAGHSGAGAGAGGTAGGGAGGTAGGTADGEATDPVAALTQAKKMLEMELITEADYEALKKRMLGL